MEHINSIDVFENTNQEFFSESNVHLSFPCKEHKEEILSRAVMFYASMRIHQYYRQQQRETAKMSVKKRKELKLQKS